MSDLYHIRHNHHHINEVSILKRLKLKQLELQSLKSKPEQFRRFRPHPNLIQCESEMVTSKNPKTDVKSNFPASTTQLAQCEEILAHRETLQRAKDFHRLLHEKLSRIDSNTSQKSELSDEAGGDHKPLQNRYQNHKHSLSHSSSGNLSDYDKDYAQVRCKNGEILHIQNRTNYRRPKNVPSAPINKTVAANKKIVASRVSLQPGLTDSEFERKLKILVVKCLQNMTGIKDLLSKGVPPPDGDKDFLRRQARAKEFTNRFSRNYLYPITTQISNLTDLDQVNPLVVNQKLLSTYQIIQNALIAYHNYLPQSCENATHDKLKVLMEHIKDICNIHRKNLENPEESYLVEFIDTFKINAELALQKITEITTLSKVGKSKISLTKSKKVLAKHGLSAQEKRLSMYRDSCFRRGKLMDKKAPVQSRYKTATYKHRPPIQKEPEIIPLSKFKTVVHTKSGNVKQTPLTTPMNEDYIKTMVEAEENGETHRLEKKESVQDGKRINGCSSKEEMLIKLLQLTLENNNNVQGPLEQTKAQISELLTMIQNQPENFLQEIFEGIRNKNGEKQDENKQQLTLEIKTSHCSVESSGEATKRRQPKVTVSGEKNARLICITDDNSLKEPSEDNNEVVNELLQQVKDAEKNLEQENIAIKNTESGKMVAKTKTQTGINGITKNVTKVTQKPKQPAYIKISRLKKSERSLKTLDKQQAISAIHYKLNFFKYCKSNLMYKKSTNCQPWQLMGKIAEELLNDSLLTIAREIEVNDVVEKVYQGELQL